MKRAAATPALSSDLLERAEAVLKLNDRGTFTIPAEGLYAHQVLWDSCFIAIGRSHYDAARGQTEIRSLLSGQWANGMIPNIIFTSGDEYELDRRVWRSRISPLAPHHVATSGISQPPMLAEAIVRIGQQLGAAQRRAWYSEVFAPLVSYHEWHYRERDPHHTGLIVQVHPWETGLDTTPPWMAEVVRRGQPWWIRFLDRTHLDKVGEIFRRDTKYVPARERSSNIEALTLYNILRRLRRLRYDSTAILKDPVLAIADLTYNSILVRANTLLSEIAAEIGQELPPGLPAHMEQTATGIKTLWDEHTQQYYSWNARTEELIIEPSFATFMPLYAGVVPPEHAQRLAELIRNPQTFGVAHPLPSVPLDSLWFKARRYWQGPTWVNTNWLIIDGLRRAGLVSEANQLTQTTLGMVDKAGFYEYFDPLTGDGVGVNHFSWTAALVIDLLSRSV